MNRRVGTAVKRTPRLFSATSAFQAFEWGTQEPLIAEVAENGRGVRWEERSAALAV